MAARRDARTDIRILLLLALAVAQCLADGTAQPATGGKLRAFPINPCLLKLPMGAGMTCVNGQPVSKAGVVSAPNIRPPSPATQSAQFSASATRTLGHSTASATLSSPTPTQTAKPPSSPPMLNFDGSSRNDPGRAPTSSRPFSVKSPKTRSIIQRTLKLIEKKNGRPLSRKQRLVLLRRIKQKLRQLKEAPPRLHPHSPYLVKVAARRDTRNNLRHPYQSRESKQFAHDEASVPEDLIVRGEQRGRSRLIAKPRKRRSTVFKLSSGSPLLGPKSLIGFTIPRVAASLRLNVPQAVGVIQRHDVVRSISGYNAPLAPSQMHVTGFVVGRDFQRLGGVLVIESAVRLSNGSSGYENRHAMRTCTMQSAAVSLYFGQQLVKRKVFLKDTLPLKSKIILHGGLKSSSDQKRGKRQVRIEVAVRHDQEQCYDQMKVELVYLNVFTK